MTLGGQKDDREDIRSERTTLTIKNEQLKRGVMRTEDDGEKESKYDDNDDDDGDDDGDDDNNHHNYKLRRSYCQHVQ